MTGWPPGFWLTPRSPCPVGAVSWKRPALTLGSYDLELSEGRPNLPSQGLCLMVRPRAEASANKRIVPPAGRLTRSPDQLRGQPLLLRTRRRHLSNKLRHLIGK